MSPRNNDTPEPKPSLIELLLWLQTRALSFDLSFNHHRSFEGDCFDLQQVEPFDELWLSHEHYERAVATQQYVSATVRPSWTGETLTVHGTDLYEALVACVGHCIRDRKEHAEWEAAHASKKSQSS